MKSKVRPPSEVSVDEKERAGIILRVLKEEFPSATTALRHENPFQLLVATILSAQCTDERVNMVTPGLFGKYPDAAAFANVSQEELEQEIHSTGFFRMKAKSIIACSKVLVEQHGGVVPGTMDDLVRLSGVGRKTANVILGQAFGVSSGVVVDTHVHRLSQRLGFSKEKTPEKIEQDLMNLFPREDWIDVGFILVLHGRKTCSARKPNCPSCTLRELCPSADSFPQSFS
jgi:endonuclease-3